MSHRKPRRPPDDCLECPNRIDERKPGIDDNVACDLPGGPTRVEGQEAYDGTTFYAPPEDCPLWKAYRRERDLAEAHGDILHDAAVDAKLEGRE